MCQRVLTFFNNQEIHEVLEDVSIVLAPVFAIYATAPDLITSQEFTLFLMDTELNKLLERRLDYDMLFSFLQKA